MIVSTLIIKIKEALKPLKDIFILLIVVFLFGSLALIYHNQESIVLAATITPEPLTELYFENHTELPKLLALPDEFEWYDNPTTSLYSITFTIKNLENKTMRYPFEIYSFEHEKVLIDEGEIIIKENESQTITENFTLPSNYSRTKFVVNLIEKNQQIFFWVEEIKQ